VTELNRKLSNHIIQFIINPNKPFWIGLLIFIIFDFLFIRNKVTPQTDFLIPYISFFYWLTIIHSLLIFITKIDIEFKNLKLKHLHEFDSEINVFGYLYLLSTITLTTIYADLIPPYTEAVYTFLILSFLLYCLLIILKSLAVLILGFHTDHSKNINFKIKAIAHSTLSLILFSSLRYTISLYYGNEDINSHFQKSKYSSLYLANVFPPKSQDGKNYRGVAIINVFPKNIQQDTNDYALRFIFDTLSIPQKEISISKIEFDSGQVLNMSSCSIKHSKSFELCSDNIGGPWIVELLDHHTSTKNLAYFTNQEKSTKNRVIFFTTAEKRQEFFQLISNLKFFVANNSPPKSCHIMLKIKGLSEAEDEFSSSISDKNKRINNAHKFKLIGQSVAIEGLLLNNFRDLNENIFDKCHNEVQEYLEIKSSSLSHIKSLRSKHLQDLATWGEQYSLNYEYKNLNRPLKLVDNKRISDRSVHLESFLEWKLDTAKIVLLGVAAGSIKTKENVYELIKKRSIYFNKTHRYLR